MCLVRITLVASIGSLNFFGGLAECTTACPLFINLGVPPGTPSIQEIVFEMIRLWTDGV